MKAGRLRHRVTIQKATVTQDGSGQPVETWSNMEDIYAQVEQVSGRELVLAKQVSPDTTHLITIRYALHVDSIKRVKFGSRVFNVLNVNHIENRQRTIELLCREVL